METWKELFFQDSFRITKLFTVQKFILEFSGNFFCFAEFTLSLSGLGGYMNTICFLNFRSHWKRMVSVGISVKLNGSKMKKRHISIVLVLFSFCYLVVNKVHP